jgi:hypothetical protein
MCCYVERRLFIVILSVFVTSVVTVHVAMLSVLGPFKQLK